jgi:hypothetical protein
VQTTVTKIVIDTTVIKIGDFIAYGKLFDEKPEVENLVSGSI